MCFFPPLMWRCVVFCPDRTVWTKKRTAVREHHPSRRWDSHFSVLHHVSCRFRWWITGSQKAVGVFQRCCNFLQRRLCWPAVFVCVLSAPKGQGSLLPSNRRRTDKQQRFVSVDTVFTDFYIYCDNLLFYICFFPSGLQVKASPPGGSGFHQLRGQIRPHVRSLQNNQAVTQSQNQWKSPYFR